MKKIGVAWLAGLCLWLGMSCAFAAEQGISSLRVQAVLHPDGSADITETWAIEEVYQGTEYYKALHNVGKNAVSDLTVTDDRGVRYTTLDTWDTGASFAEKADKCGILPTDEGYELCWGISEMGDRTYTISYRLAGLVKHYSDADGFYYQFISDGMSSPPKAAEVRVCLAGTPLTPENSSIWAFGYTGKVTHAEGEIVARSSEALKKNDYVNLLVGFEPGLFDAPEAGGTFAAVQDRALHPGKVALRVMGGILAGVAAVTAAVFLWLKSLTRNIRLADGQKVPRVSEKRAELRRQPALDSLAATHMLMKLGAPFGQTGAIVSAYMIQWGLSGAASIEQDGKKATLVLHRPPQGELPENTLYGMFQEVSDEGRLPLKAWQKWLGKNESRLPEWHESLEAFGQRKLEEAGLVQADAKGRPRLTQAGNEAYAEALGYKKYLKQIAKQETGAPPAEDQWRLALVFAAYFGLAAAIAPAFDRVGSGGQHDGFTDWNAGYYLFATQSGRSFSTPPGGSGGSSYASGGGGFSGGGGGGSR